MHTENSKWWTTNLSMVENRIPPLTKSRLFGTLGIDGPAYITLPNGVRGILQNVQRESGNGSCFNVTMLVGDKHETFYVRTID